MAMTKMRIGFPRIYGLLMLVLGAAVVSPLHASLVTSGIATGTGAGINTNNVILTIQNNPTEQGCVGWGGAVDVIGAAACPGGLSPAIVGGDEKTGNSQTQTRLVSATGVLSGQSLVVILTMSEPAGTLFTIENLSLTVYGPTGVLLYNSGNLFGAGIPPGGGVTENSSLQGQGALGFGFLLDSAQAAAISPFICTNALITGCAGVANAANANNRIGLAALIANTQGGNEIFSVADKSNVAITAITSVPEPVTGVTVFAALMFLGLARRPRRMDQRIEVDGPGDLPTVERGPPRAGSRSPRGIIHRPHIPEKSRC